MGKSFRETVYELTKLIPPGYVATYKQIAVKSGKPKAARVVGLFMKSNPYIPQVPCHRVVGSDGQLTGYSGQGGKKKKEQLLKKEGVVFSGKKINLTISQWKPL